MQGKALPGFRDFYPEELALKNHIFATWRGVAARYGFEEYDGPPLEPLELYTKKSGDEIVQQLYAFRDKGDRDVALRPEMTPTLARMVAAHAQALKKPIRWFSLPQLFRYERQQRGRLREHFQLNMDIIGEAGPLADAELIAAAIDNVRAFGFGPGDVQVRVSDRRVLRTLLLGGGLSEVQLPTAFEVIDKSERVPQDALALVDHFERRRQLHLRKAATQQQGPEDAPVRHPDLDISRPEPERPHDVDRRGDQLGVGRGAGLADDVHVELEVLPQASSLLPLVAKQLREREPADRLFQGLGPRAHHARERRGHLGAQRHLAATLVLECVQLLHDLRTALLGIELQRLERRPVVLLEAVAARHLAPGGEDRVPESEVFRVKVAKATEGLSLHRNNLGDRREAGQAGERVPDGVKRAGDDHRLRVLLHQLERALEVALEGVCDAERTELALDAPQVPPTLGRRRVRHGEHEAIDLLGQALDHPEVVLVAQHAHERPAGTRRIGVVQRLRQHPRPVGVVRHVEDPLAAHLEPPRDEIGRAHV